MSTRRCSALLLSSFLFSSVAEAHHPGAMGVSKVLRAPKKLGQTHWALGTTSHFFYRAPREASYQNPLGEAEDLLFAQSFSLMFAHKRLSFGASHPVVYRPRVLTSAPLGLGDLQSMLSYDAHRSQKHLLQLSILNGWPTGSSVLQSTLGLFSQDLRASYRFTINTMFSIRAELGTQFFYTPNTALVLLQEQSLRFTPHRMFSVGAGLQSQIFLNGGEWPGLQVDAGQRNQGDLGLQARMSLSLLLNPGTQFSLQGSIPIFGPRNNDGSVSLGFSKSFGI